MNHAGPSVNVLCSCGMTGDEEFSAVSSQLCTLPVKTNGEEHGEVSASGNGLRMVEQIDSQLSFENPEQSMRGARAGRWSELMRDLR